MKPTMIFNLAYWIVLLSTITLLGCDVPEKESKEAFMKRIKTQGASPIKNFSVKTNPTERHRPPKITNDPFKHLKLKPFENVLEDLKMIGTIERAHQKWGIILLPTGKFITVTQGDYLALYQIRIDSIAKDKIWMIKRVTDPHGKWHESKVSIALVANPL